LTAFPVDVFDPAFSPGGHLLAVGSTLLDGAQGIFLIPAFTFGRPLTGKLAYRVTRGTDDGFDVEPQFSPDGRWIVFTRYSECTDEGCQTRIFRVRTTGRDLQPLTDTQLNASAPDFHPSGRWIAFDTHDTIAPSPSAGHIAVANADGSGQRIIARADADSSYGNPSFSPDGREIAFTHWPIEPDGNFLTASIWTARVDGSRPRQITSSAFHNKADWGPKPRHGHHH
jgi:TolB protein